MVIILGALAVLVMWTVTIFLEQPTAVKMTGFGTEKQTDETEKQTNETEKQTCEGVNTDIGKLSQCFDLLEGVKTDIEKLSQRFDLLPDDVAAKMEAITRKAKRPAPGTPAPTNLAPRPSLPTSLAPGPPFTTRRVSE